MHELVHLGEVDDGGSMELDVQRRISKVCDTLKWPNKMWRTRDIGSSTQVKDYETLVVNILLYNAETWIHRGVAWERDWLFPRWAAWHVSSGVSRCDRIRNEDIVVHTFYCYGSFSFVFKLINLTRFILKFMTELTVSQRKLYTQHTYLLFNCSRENTQIRKRTINTLLSVDTSPF